jgi:uncharacterized membrane protein YeaQ/YmgE (transglycosylase-associated protein family)
MIGTIIGTLIGGTILGFLGRVVAPKGRDEIPLYATVLSGIVGMTVGGFIYSLFGGDGSPGVDWTYWAVAILCSAAAVMGAAAILGKRSA